MDGHSTDWHPFSFTRSPTWRFLRATYRVQERRAFDPRIDDEWVDVAMRLVASDRKGIPPEACAAFDLWNADKSPRWFLEASLLTAQAFDEIATACGLAEAVVRAFHQLFFDVKPRLNAHDWILTQAVRSHPANDFAGPQPAGIWKYMAFKGGPLVLDIVAAVTNNRPLPERLRTTFGTNPELEEKRLRLKTKVAIAALTAKSERQLGSLLELSEELDELEAGAGPGRETAETLTPVVGEFIAQMNRLVPAEATLTKLPSASAAPKSLRSRAAQPVLTSPRVGGSHRE